MTPAPRQLPLPTVDMRPLCPLCGAPADVLGQYSPLWPYVVCRACSLDEPFPVEVFEDDPKGNDKSGLRIRRDASDALRGRRVALENRVKEAVIGVPPVIPYKFNLTGFELRNPIRYGVGWRLKRPAPRAFDQIDLPFCHRCGWVHDRHTLDGLHYHGHCQQCADEMAVETLWQMRGIFGEDDDETILDRIYRSHAELFERGLLPDAWFRLRAEEARETHAE